MDTIATRIIELVNVQGGNKSEFARRINVTPAYISKLSRQPDCVPSDRTIFDICREFNVNEDWLRTGKGEMFLQRSRGDELAAFFGDLLREDTPDFRRRLVSVLSRLSVEEWALVEKMARKLADEINGEDREA